MTADQITITVILNAVYILGWLDNKIEAWRANR